MNIISVRKRIVDTDVVSDFTYTRQSVITRVVIRFFYDTALSTELQRRHMIKYFTKLLFRCNDALLSAIMTTLMLVTMLVPV